MTQRNQPFVYQSIQIEEPNIIGNESDFDNDEQSEHVYKFLDPTENEELKAGELQQIRQLMGEQHMARQQLRSTKKRRRPEVVTSSR